MRWVEEDGLDRVGNVPPDNQEVVAFLLKFEQYEINTILTGFQNMLHDLKMQLLFEFKMEPPTDIKMLPENDHEKALCIYNFDWFCSFVQCLMNFWLCVPKGQHRAWILDMFLTGRFDLSYSIPSIINFTSEDAKWVYRHWGHCQLWCLTDMQVGSVWDPENGL
jgi:hypothetical protein